MSTIETASEQASAAQKRLWEAPVVHEVKITDASDAPDTTGSGAREPLHLRSEHPPLPSASTSKLGFSMEMAFPLATRTGSS